MEGRLPLGHSRNVCAVPRRPGQATVPCRRRRRGPRHHVARTRATAAVGKAGDMIAGPPEEEAGHVAVPDVVVDVADGRAIRPVWVNALGGVTFALGDGPAACFVKWAPAGSGLDLSAEAVRLTWDPHRPGQTARAHGERDPATRSAQAPTIPAAGTGRRGASAPGTCRRRGWSPFRERRQRTSLVQPPTVWISSTLYSSDAVRSSVPRSPPAPPEPVHDTRHVDVIVTSNGSRPFNVV